MGDNLVIVKMRPADATGVFRHVYFFFLLAGFLLAGFLLDVFLLAGFLLDVFLETFIAAPRAFFVDTFPVFAEPLTVRFFLVDEDLGFAL